MSWLEWSDTYRLGVPVLDQDHKDLVNQVAGVYDMAAAGLPVKDVACAVNRLLEMFHDHFDREEAYLALLTSPAGREHRRKHVGDHAQFLEHLAVLRGRLAHGQDVRDAVDGLSTLLALVELIQTDFEMVGLLRREGRIDGLGHVREPPGQVAGATC